MTTSSPILTVEGVSKKYSNHKALDDVSLQVDRGKVFCLLGQNGAGKTTLIKGALGLIHFDRGTAKINGIDTKDWRSRQIVSYLPEKFQFFPYYSVEHLLHFFCSTNSSVDKQSLSKTINEALDLMHVQDLKKKKLAHISKGQLQRVALASIFSQDKDFVILDEPFSGMDPLGIAGLKEAIEKRKAQGTTFFINTHLLGEVESICDHFAIIHKGKTLRLIKREEFDTQSTIEHLFLHTVKNHEN